MVHQALDEKGQAEIIQLLKSDSKEAHIWYAVLDYFEDIGVHYNMNTIDQPFIRKVMQTSILRLWNKLHSVIIELRKELEHETMYAEFERMCSDMRSIR